MPEPTATTPVAGKDDLRLVLFGLPAAGKSSLLGALEESAKIQEHLLHGRLTDRTGGLIDLDERLYTDRPSRTAEEVAPYPVEYEPFSSDGPAQAPEKIQAVLIDCDGRVANDLLQARQSLDENSPEGSLAREVVNADTLVLVVDASAPPEHIEADFTEFRRFLKLMEKSRGRRAEVGGLPVFLVLTKCDLLAQSGDTPVAWMERIEQRKRDVDAHFREFLAREEADRPSTRLTGPEEIPSALEAPPHEPGQEAGNAPSGLGGFGRLDLHIWATAVKRPALTGSPAKPREPYGVAELFRQCFSEAEDYRRRCRRSTRRLAGTVIGTVGLVTGMLVLAGVLLVVNRNSRAALLAESIDNFRALDKGTAAERLRGSPEKLTEKANRLRKMRDDPQFPDVKPELREFVEERLAELDAYIPYLRKVLDAPPPSEARSEEKLDQRINRLKKELTPPQPEWTDTDAARTVRRQIEEGEALRRAVQTATNWYLDSTDAASKLRTFADYRTAADIDWADWTGQVEKLIDPGRKPPFNEDDPIPGAPGTHLTYRTAMRFDKVADARSAWEVERTRLSRLLQVCSALALAPPTMERPALLVFPRTFSLKDCRSRVMELKKFYPNYQTAFIRDVLPDTLAPRIRQVVRAQYHNLLIPARAEVLRQLQLAGSGREETAARWSAVRTWLQKPEELESWRVLANVLLHLDDPAAEDPVTALTSFLAKRNFLIEVRTITLEVPELRSLRPRAESRFIVLHPASDRQPALAFEPSGERRRDPERRVWLYTYRLDSSVAGSLTYTPGDKLWAELPLRGGRERLVWADTRSMMYQLERLLNPPRLQLEGATSLTEGRRLDDVRLRFAPEDGVPRVPDLMPEVRLE
jgi:GTPase SAR1 family protein